MLDPAHLAALAAVHRRGTFDQAASQLHVSQSAISQRIKALEEQVGTVLIQRGQPCRATETGLRLIQHYDTIALLERQVRSEITGTAPNTATVRIAVNADSLATWFLPALAQCDGFLFDTIIDDENASRDWLSRGEVAGAVTSQARPVQGCDTLSLGNLRYVAAASPAYMQHWMPEGPTDAALMRAPTLVFSDKDKLQEDWVHQFTQGRCHRAALRQHRIGSTHGFLDACLLGMGWAMHPEILARPYLKAGTLVPLAPAHPYDSALYWQFSRLTAEAIAPLTQAIKQAARQYLT